MSREIKFRAWDAATKTIIYRIVDGGAVTSKAGETVMQYIGLKDKNGIEIYEGDIIKVSARYDSTMGEVYYEEKETAYCFKVDVGNPHETPYRRIGNGWYGIEIVGNIFKNKEEK